MTPLRCSILLLLAALTACTGFSRRELEDSENEGYWVNKGWANAARFVTSKDTPADEGGDAPVTYGSLDKEKREDGDLTDLDEEDSEDLGHVVVDLGAGVWEIDDIVRLQKPKTVVIKGKGPNKTRLELDNKELKTLVITGAKRVVFKNLTVASLSGGGVWIKDCPEVKIENTHFASARFGLHLSGSTARISSSVFVGCQTGLRARDKSTVTLRETAFKDNWQAIKSTDSGLDIESCAFVENRIVIQGSIDRRSRVVGCLLYGTKQDLGWKGVPRMASHNLTHFRSLEVQLGTETNRELRSIDDFPRSSLWPDDLNVVAVHLALERQQNRGKQDYDQHIKDVCQEEAQRFATASQKAVRASDLKSARKLAKIALSYWGDRPLKDAPEELLQIAELAK